MTSEHDTPSAIEAVIRSRLGALLDPATLNLTLLVVGDHRSDSPVVYDVPISVELSRQLLTQVIESAAAAADSELRPVDPGFTPSPGQWVHADLVDGPLVEVESLVLRPTHPQYDRDVEFGRRNVLVFRVRDAAGDELARLYQAFSPEKALQHTRRILAFWNGERFTSLDAEPLVIDRLLRLFAFDDVVVMKNNSAYESLFGALPELKVQAAATFAATFGKLTIVGAEGLEAACRSDINMMRKLLSIQQKMDQPGYPEALNMPSVLSFLARNSHIDVPIDSSGGSPALVFSPHPQHRWALLKLLDDDFLRSDLTNINYEANSKSEVPSNSHRPT